MDALEVFQGSPQRTVATINDDSKSDSLLESLGTAERQQQLQETESEESHSFPSNKATSLKSPPLSPSSCLVEFLSSDDDTNDQQQLALPVCSDIQNEASSVGILASSSESTLSSILTADMIDSASDESASAITVNDDEWIHYLYNLSRDLGKGSFATVKLAEKRTSFETVAVKIIEKSKVPRNEFLRNHLREEMKILKSIAHPETIIRVFQVIEAPTKIYIVTEACLGGDLQEYLDSCEGGHVSESEARFVMEQVADAVSYLHSRGIVHRDIKSENILLSRPNELNIKLTDFSVSKFVGTDAADSKFWMSSFCGTPSWMSPEIFLHVQKNTKGYTYEVDLWSMGVLCYQLLSGHLPFEEGRIDLLMKAKYSFSRPVWQKVSMEAKDLIQKLLVADPSNRLTIAQLRQHRWFSTTLPESESEPDLQNYEIVYDETPSETAACIVMSDSCSSSSQPDLSVLDPSKREYASRSPSPPAKIQRFC